jgi:hypothetical protein
MVTELNDFLAERRLEDAIWSRMATAALKVGCPVEQAEAYCERCLDSCKPLEMQRDGSGVVWGDWGDGHRPHQLHPPFEENEVLHAQYQAALADLLGMLDGKTLEGTFADMAGDA